MVVPERLDSTVRAMGRRWRWGVGLALLAGLVLSVGPSALVETLRRVSVPWALLVSSLSVLWLLLGALNVWILLRRLAPLPLASFLPPYLHSWALSLLLPGQLGDATQVLLLRRHGVAVARSSAAYLVDKALSLSWILLVSLYGAALFLPALRGPWVVAWLTAGIAVGALAVWALRRLRARPGSLLARARDLAGRVLGELGRLRRHPGALAANVALTIVKWIVASFMYWAAFRAFGFALDLEAAATLPMMSSLAGYIPVSVGGVGTMEWTAVALFRRVGADAATVLSVYLLLRAILYLTALFCLARLRNREATRAKKSAGA